MYVLSSQHFLHVTQETENKTLTDKADCYKRKFETLQV